MKGSEKEEGREEGWKDGVLTLGWSEGDPLLGRKRGQIALRLVPLIVSFC